MVCGRYQIHFILSFSSFSRRSKLYGHLRPGGTLSGGAKLRGLYSSRQPRSRSSRAPHGPGQPEGGSPHAVHAAREPVLNTKYATGPTAIAAGPHISPYRSLPSRATALMITTATTEYISPARPPGITKGRAISGFLRRNCQAASTVKTVVATRSQL